MTRPLVIYGGGRLLEELVKRVYSVRNVIVVVKPLPRPIVCVGRKCRETTVEAAVNAAVAASTHYSQ